MGPFGVGVHESHSHAASLSWRKGEKGTPKWTLKVLGSTVQLNVLESFKLEIGPFRLSECCSLLKGVIIKN